MGASVAKSLAMLPVRETFDAVAHCPNVGLCIGGDRTNPCFSIVSKQHASSIDSFQLPEPWVGQIDVAPLLFVSSNPSIGKDDHATGSSLPDEVWESHHLAFGGGTRAYILDGVKTTTRDGKPIKTVKYWSSVRARARELLPAKTVLPGTDYALTEVVHCKTEGEFGVAEAVDECYKRFMDRVWSVAAARVVVVFGKVARDKMLGVGAEQPKSFIERDLGGRRRTLVFLPHPNARGVVKSFAKNYSAQVLEELRGRLN